MNCAECQTDPLTPEHYCPCCGRKLSLQERRIKESAPPVARCLSCGGMSADGSLCKSCQQALAPALGATRVTTVSPESATPSRPTAPTIVKTTAAPTSVPVPVPVVKTMVATPQNVAETFKVEAFTNDTARAVADLTAKAHLARAANPPPVIRRPIVPPAPQTRSRRPMWLAAGAVIVVAVGAATGARRLGFQWPVATAPEGQVQAMPAQEKAVTVERSAMPTIPDSAMKVPAATRASSAGPAQAAARRKPRTPAQQAAGARQTNVSNRQVAPVVGSVPAAEIPAPVTRPPSPAVTAQRAPDPPTGRFFERTDVDQSPQVATRVEPQLPAKLSARAKNDVVVVRVLVSRSGHPFRINLLRGSRLGRSADEAVVAAVTQWTFSPAMKRGEPVNCWYNIGVPLGRTN